MHIHILGICGTFMGGLAILARQLGHTVSGSDMNVYPPMSDQLKRHQIELRQGYEPSHLETCRPDLVVIGNAMSRGNPLVEAVLNSNIPYTSGPQWLADHVLKNRWTLAVAGTHGKTTTASMLAWILEHAGLKPGYLIGGVPENFGISARLGDAPFFVVEADEYDTAFFDKRSKFIHYRPRTVILNNLEYDHADIFANLDEIKRQFHHFLRTVPANGLLLVNGHDHNLQEVLEMGCWTPTEHFREAPPPGGIAPQQAGAAGGAWTCSPLSQDFSHFAVHRDGQALGKVAWELIGHHNALNGLAAAGAARHAGVTIETSLKALSRFRNVKRRLELRAVINGISVYDDFAHHPTAIRSTLEALRAHVGKQRIIAVLEPRSNTMRMGAHSETLAGSLLPADQVVIFQPEEVKWDLASICQALGPKARLLDSIDEIVNALLGELQNGDHVVFMSNGGFGGIHAKLIRRLNQ
jgi:UDP-N-acetylmuramate: L-alanyl-gamma-D-glutamyl-meso-diaminopimelate ligase